MSSKSDALVSTALLRQRREEERGELERLRPFLDDTVANYAERILTAWERAEVDAEREFVSTAKAAYLTGWSEDTLRDRAKRGREGRAMPAGWEGLLATWDGQEWAFCVSSIPTKGRKAAA